MGRAWKLAIQTQHVDQTATLSFWLIDAPHSHPFWPWHVLALVHLRDIEGQSKPAHKRYPEAEYELLILAIDPEVCPPDPDDYDGGFTLSPPDVMEQFDVKGSDRDAIRIVEASDARDSEWTHLSRPGLSFDVGWDAQGDCRSLQVWCTRGELMPLRMQEKIQWIECDGCGDTIRPHREISKSGWIKTGFALAGTVCDWSVQYWCPKCVHKAPMPAA
jgi:hypothetical protein